MPLLSLRTRLVALFLVSLATAAFLFAAVAVRQFSQEERSRARSELSRQALEHRQADQGVRRASGCAAQAGAPQDFTSALGEHHGGARVLRRALRPAAADRGALRQGAEGHGGRGSTGSCSARRASSSARRRSTSSSPTAPRRSPPQPDFRYGGQLIGAIVFARPVRSISASTLVQGRRVVPPLLLAVAAAALVAVLLSRRITRPVQELTEASERVARGDYDVHLTSKGPDELGQLALRFEQMARQLKEASEHERNFLMRISHELRTPLTAIQGHVQAIADGVIEGEEEQSASLEIVLAEAGRLQRLIGDLLDLARLETRRFSLNVEEVDLLDGVRERGRRAARGRAWPPCQPARARRSEARSWSATATACCRSSRISSRTPCTRRPPTARSRSTSRSARARARRGERYGPRHPPVRARVDPAAVRDERRAPRRRARPPGRFRARAGDGRDNRRR